MLTPLRTDRERQIFMEAARLFLQEHPPAPAALAKNLRGDDRELAILFWTLMRDVANRFLVRLHEEHLESIKPGLVATWHSDTRLLAEIALEYLQTPSLRAHVQAVLAAKATLKAA